MHSQLPSLFVWISLRHLLSSRAQLNFEEYFKSSPKQFFSICLKVLHKNNGIKSRLNLNICAPGISQEIISEKYFRPKIKKKNCEFADVEKGWNFIKYLAHIVVWKVEWPFECRVELLFSEKSLKKRHLLNIYKIFI